MINEVKAGGLWCSEVLALLSEYVDKELPAAQTAQIEAHLAECDRCLSFGTQFSAMIQELVSKLSVPESLGEAAAQRLRERLRASLFRDRQTGNENI